MKRKNPFAGKTRNIDPNIDDIEDIAQELQKLEKELGKEKFNRLLDEAIRRYDELEGNHDGTLEDDEDLYNLDAVTVQEWKDTHPANLTCASDSYYAALATDLCDIISEFTLPASAPHDLPRELGRVLAAYLEDIVSGTKVFSAMRRVCRQRYGYMLPFYDCEHQDYMLDHINEEDIRFLIWKTACQLGKERNTTFSPLATGWALIADRVFDELNSRYEEAPEARRVADWLQRTFRKDDYVLIRDITTWLVFNNPLSYLPGFMDTILEGVEQVYRDERIGYNNITPMIYGLIASESWQRSMSPMGCAAKTLAGAMACEFGYDTLAEDIEAIEVLPKQIYAIERDRKNRKIFFETSDHIKLEVERESFAKGFRPEEIQYAQCNLLKYKGKYMLNGMLTGNPDLKTLWENQQSFISFERQSEQAQELISIMDGRQVVCVTNINTILKKLGFPTYTEGQTLDAKNFIVMLSRELGLAVLPDMGYAFDIPGNRFFRKRAAAKDSFSDLVFHNSIPQDVAVYIQKHNLLPQACIGASQGKAVGRQIVQDYLAFWIGFYRELPPYGTAPRIDPDENPDD